MIKRLLVLGLLCWTQQSFASLEEDGIWKAGAWETTVWADGVWFEGAGGGTVPTTNVVGLSAAAADTALEADGLDTGAITMRCSSEPVDEVVSQNPAAGVEVAPATLVDLLTSNGAACAPGGRSRLRLGLGLGL